MGILAGNDGGVGCGPWSSRWREVKGLKSMMFRLPAHPVCFGGKSGFAQVGSKQKGGIKDDSRVFYFISKVDDGTIFGQILKEELVWRRKIKRCMLSC